MNRKTYWVIGACIGMGIVNAICKPIERKRDREIKERLERDCQNLADDFSADLVKGISDMHTLHEEAKEDIERRKIK